MIKQQQQKTLHQYVNWNHISVYFPSITIAFIKEHTVLYISPEPQREQKHFKVGKNIVS